MSKNKLVKIPQGRSIIALASAALLVLPVLAEDTNAPTVLKPTVVTGSYIPTAETVGVAPVDTVSTADIEKVGTQDILLTLKALNPAFSGNANIGQSLNNGGFGESYIALRNLPTLVLIDGKRLNISPFSTFVGTFSPDLNMIPISMIERVEILKDGASATYGSDAIGGVVNIITKKDFTGGDVSMHYGFGLDKGKYNEYRFSGDVGYSKDGTRFVAGGQYYYADPIFTQNRAIGSLSAQELEKAGLNAPSYFSPSYPGRVGNFILAGSSLAQGAPGYNAAITAPPRVTGGPFTTVEAYNAAAFAQLGVTPYIPISTTPAGEALGSASILNTTLLGPISLQRQDRRSAFANFEQDIFDDHLTAYGQLIYSETESKGQLAPAPIPLLALYNLTIPADNPGNVFGIPIGTGATNATPRVRSRLIETGPRAFDTIDSFWHFVGGVKGNVLDNHYHYDVNAAYSQTTAEQLQNSASSLLLNQALTPDGAGLSQLSDANGHVPLYNLLAEPGVNDPRTIRAIAASDAQNGFSDLFEMQGVFRGEIFELPAGPFQLAAGAQFVHEKLTTTAGSLLASGNLIGLNALPPFPGGIREREAGFLEAHIPVLKPDHNIPGLYSFEITAAGRYETIDSHATSGSSEVNSHDTLVPKVGFRWQPLDDQFTIRGTYSQGFVVPQLNQLFGPPLNSFPYIVAPDDTVPTTDPHYFQPLALQQNVNYIANPDVPPSTAETFTLGIVISPKAIDGLTVSADYYHIEQPEYNFIPSGSRMVEDLNARGTGSIYYNNPALHGTPVYLDADGNPHVPTPGDPTTYITANNFGTLNIPLLPGGSIRTEGVDLAANYRWNLKDYGVLNLFANANVLFAYDVKLGKDSPWMTYKGEYTDSQAVAAPQGMIPDYNLSMGFTYSLKNFDYTVIAHYLPGVTDLGDMHPSVGSPVNDFTKNGRPWQVDPYFKVDMQLAYTFRSEAKKWWNDTRIAVGVNNISDEAPNLIASSSEDNTDKGSYDIIGRFLYFELSKKF